LFDIIEFFLVDKHVNIFKEDLSQLVRQLNRLVFVDIYGQSSQENVLAYCSMIEEYFPNCQFYMDLISFSIRFLLLIYK